MLEELRRRLAEIQATRAAASEAAAALTEGAETRDEQRLTEEESATFDGHLEAIRSANAEIAEIQGRIKDLEDLAAARAAAPPVPYVSMNRNPFDLSDLRYGAGREEIHARVRSVLSNDRVDETIFNLSSRQREQMDQLLRSVDTPDGRLGRRVLATGQRAYYSAFSKAMAGAEALFNDDEKRAVSEMRAASVGTDAAGGYAIPFSVDTTMISTDAGSVNPFRQISTVKQIMADVWQGVSSAGVSASFDAEAAEVSDDTPTLAAPSITTRMARAFVPFSIEIGGGYGSGVGDWANMEADLRSMFSDAKDDLETTVFSTGASGSNQPIGIITALTGTASEINAAGEAVALADLYSLDSDLPARYRMNASWVANKGIYNAIRALDVYGGGGMWTQLGAGQPSQLLGYPTYLSSGFDQTIVATATANNYVMVLGDFKAGYYIIDRVGMNVELVPHLFATANNLPSGQRGLFAFWRVGADSVNDDAFRMLDVATTA